jgi:uncharacterized RDD family membrane protein YckC
VTAALAGARQPYAGLVSRAAALTIDGMLMAVAVPTVASGIPSIWASLQGSAPGWVSVLCQAGAALLPVVYFGLCWSATGQTIGGLLLGTVVRRPDGSHVGLGRALLRALAGLALPVIWLAGMLWVLWDGKRRALHDRLFNTVVLYRTPPRPAKVTPPRPAGPWR